MLNTLRACLRRLWAEQQAFVVSSELVLTGSLLLGGAVVGLTQLRDTLTQELGDVATAIGNLDQSYSIGGIRGHSAFTAGSAFYDRADVCDGVMPPGPPHVIVPGHRVVHPTVCADVFPSVAPRVAPPPPGPPPHVAPPALKQPPAPEKKPPAAPPKKQPSVKDGAAAPPQPVLQPAPCGHPQVQVMVGGSPLVGCLSAGCPGCVPGVGQFGGGYGVAATNYSFPSVMNSPYGVRQWGSSRGFTSTVIDFQGAGVAGASGVPGWSVTPGAGPCAHGAGCTACTGTVGWAGCGAGCGTMPVWGPREGSLPQQKIVFTAAPQPHQAPGPKLEGIELRFSEVGDDDLQPLKGFADVKVLHIHGSRVTDAGLEHLRGLKKLESLHLVGTQITDAGLKHLAELEGLRALHIHGGKLSPSALNQLAALKHLHVLVIEGAGVPPEAVARFLDKRAPQPGKE